MADLDPADSAAVQDAIGQYIGESGVYYVPQMTDADSEARHATGPLVQLFVHSGGAEMMNPVGMFMGLVVMFVAALIFGFLVKGIPVAQGSVGATVKFGLLVGLAAAVWSNLGNPFWFYHPWGYSIGVALYDLVSFTLFGVVFGLFFKGDQAQI